MTLTLYYMPIACSLVPYVALTEAGAEFDVRVVNMMRGDHMTPEYLHLNPKHKVPVLIIDGEPLTENVAILQWIARQFPAAQLLPSDPMMELKAVSFMSWCASGIHPFLTPNVLPQRYCDLPGSEDSVRRCAQTMTYENYGVAEAMLAGHDWFFDQFTIADVYFFWCFRRGTQFKMDVSRFPNCQAHFDRVSARPSVQKLLAFEAETMASMAKAS